MSTQRVDRCLYFKRGNNAKLINRLQHAHDRGQILCTPALYNRLAAKHFELKDKTPKLATLPVFLHHDCPFSALTLYPIYPDTNRYWAATPPSGTMFQRAKAVLSIHIQEPTPGDMRAFSDISSQQIRIDREYPSTSKLTPVGLATTFDIWYRLPKNPAITSRD